MAKSTVLNLADDTSALRKYVAMRVAAQAVIGKSISAIEFCYQVTQGGLLLLHFDTRPVHLLDNRVTLALGKGQDIELPHCAAAYEKAEEHGGTFVLPGGDRREVQAGSSGDDISCVFGEAVRAIALDAVAASAFAPLTVLDNCELFVEDFDGMWGFKEKLAQLRGKRLPR